MGVDRQLFNALKARKPDIAHSSSFNNHTCKPREINAFRGLWTNRGSFVLPPDAPVSVKFRLTAEGWQSG